MKATSRLKQLRDLRDIGVTEYTCGPDSFSVVFGSAAPRIAERPEPDENGELEPEKLPTDAAALALRLGKQ